MKNENDKNFNYRSVGVFLSAGMTMAASVVIGYFLGAWLDSYLGTKPWLSLVMLLVGTAAGLKALYDLAFKQKE